MPKKIEPKSELTAEQQEALRILGNRDHLQALRKPATAWGEIPVTVTVDEAENASAEIQGEAGEKPKRTPKRKRVVPEPTTEHEELNIYFESDSGVFYRTDSNGTFIKANTTDITRHLGTLGFVNYAGDGEIVSPLAMALEYLQTNHNVAYAGPLAGHKSGLHQIHGRKILVTEGPRLIEPAPGEWPTLRSIFDGLLGDEQARYFYGWLQVGLLAIRAERQRGGQALVLAGPPQCGKSLLQSLITEMLGGRDARPYSSMTGKTDFNSELFGSESLVIEDEAASGDPRVRKVFGAEIKKVTVNKGHRAHRKNREALSLRPVWRLTISLNNDVTSLQVLPQLDAGILDKIMLLNCSMFPMPIDTSTEDGEDQLWALLTSEMPAFIDFVLNEHTISPDMKDARFGVAAFHNPDLLDQLDSTSDEIKLLELIDRMDPWEIGSITGAIWEAPATEIEDRLIEQFPSQTRRLFSYSSACGQLLGLLRTKTTRVDKRKLTGQTLWRIEKL